MECPYCYSTQVRKASAVYEDGTQTSTMRTRGVGIGISAKGAGAGLFGSRGVGRSTSIAARKADKARPVWIGFKGGLALFLVLCVVFAANHLHDPFGKALVVAILVMFAVPVATTVQAELRNRDYDRRWYCDTCGEIWTSHR